MTPDVGLTGLDGGKEQRFQRADAAKTKGFKG